MDLYGVKIVDFVFTLLFLLLCVTWQSKTCNLKSLLKIAQQELTKQEKRGKNTLPDFYFLNFFTYTLVTAALCIHGRESAWRDKKMSFWVKAG